MMSICDYEEFALNFAVICNSLAGFFSEVEKNPNEFFYWSPLDPTFYDDENIIEDEICYKSLWASYPLYDPTYCVLLEINPDLVLIRATYNSKYGFAIDLYKNKE